MSNIDYSTEVVNGITPSSFSPSSNGKLSEVEFRVPLYQRLFVWEEEQINQLFNDLYQAFRDPSPAPYYIGALTVKVTTDKSVPIWELVDGQQRITALTLLGACLDRQATSSIWSPFVTKGDGPRLTYCARPADQNYLKNIIAKEPDAKVENVNMNNFIKLYDRFVTEKKLGSNEPDNLSTFSSFVYEKATALVSILPDSYEVNDLNLYFEKMNAAGKQLEAHEILKVRYFGDFSARWNVVADGSKGYVVSAPLGQESGNNNLTLKNLLKTWAGLTDDQKKKKKEPDREEIASDSSRLVIAFPVFLLHVLSICIGIKDAADKIAGFWNPKKLLATFQSTYKTWTSNGGSAEEFVKVMEYYRTWMDKWIIHIQEDNPVSPYNYLNGSGEGGKGSAEMVEAHKEDIWQFQSMLHVSSLSSDVSQRWVLDAYLESKDLQPNDTNREKFLEMLKQQDNTRRALKPEGDVANWSYGQIDRYWFWKLDYILWEKRAELFADKAQRDVVDCYTFRQNRSIEHLHPQNPQTPAEGWEPEPLNSFGNLAMISAGFNSQQGNDSVGTKFGRMGDQMDRKELQSIKLLLMFNNARKKDSGWTEDASKDHGAEMIKILESYYQVMPPEWMPRPGQWLSGQGRIL